MSTVYADFEFAILLGVGFTIFILLVVVAEKYLSRKEENDRAERRKDQTFRW